MSSKPYEARVVLSDQDIRSQPRQVERIVFILAGLVRKIFSLFASNNVKRQHIEYSSVYHRVSMKKRLLLDLFKPCFFVGVCGWGFPLVGLNFVKLFFCSFFFSCRCNKYLTQFTLHVA